MTEHAPSTSVSNFSDLFERRLVFVVGKGGVGKTTLTMTLGLAARRLNKRVLLVELEEADVIGPFFGLPSLPSNAVEIQPGFWGVRINPRDELEAYVNHHVGVRFLARKITRSRVFDSLARATPGLREVMTLGQIWRLEQARDDENRPLFDLIIVDAPATGHGLSLLRVPKTLVDMINMGPIAKQIKVVQDMLQNSEVTWLTLVTLPEELPVNEAVQFQETALQELHMNVNVIFINCVYPDLFDEDEARLISQISEADISPNDATSAKAVFQAAQSVVLRRELQQTHIRVILEKALNQVKMIPFYFTNDLTLNEINDIATGMTS